MSAIEPARTGAPGGLGTLGRYQLLEPIASGGMGAVYLARLAGDGGFEKLVALKVLLPDISRDSRFVAMFLDEARIAARLSHPHLCEVYELGSADGRHFIAMQYLRGLPVAEMLRTPPADRSAFLRVFASLIAQACEGLHHAHELRDADGKPLSVVHRDVSPPNLFVTNEGVLKVLDFGIAKARDVDSKTARSELKGKQAYMSPEQLVGKTLDRRSDIFSIGVVLYEGITGTRLFSRETDFLIAKAILEEDVDDPRQRRPEVPPALAEVVLKALARRPEDRFATARELGLAIGTALAPGGAMSPVMIAEFLSSEFGAALAADRARFERATKTSHRSAETGGRRRRGGARRRGWLAPVLGLILVAALAVGGWVLWRGQTTASQSAARADAGAGAPGATAPTTAPTTTDIFAPADAAPIIEATPVDAAPPGEPDAASEKSNRRGKISIDSTPYATIYVEGRRIGVTPIIGYKVKPGRRRIKAVLASGETKRFSIRVRPGKQAPAKRLTW